MQSSYYFSHEAVRTEGRIGRGLKDEQPDSQTKGQAWLEVEGRARRCWPSKTL